MTIIQKKVVLFAMTEKGFKVVEHIVSFQKEVINFVVIGQDKNVENDYSENIISLCKSNNVKYFLKKNAPIISKDQYIFTISWRWMIKHPSDKLIVFHDSLLPKYRGFAPLVNMLINGEDEIGVSAIFGASEYDRGNLISQKSSKIRYPIKISEAIKINQKNFLYLVEEIIKKICSHEPISGSPQNEEEISYSIWRDYDDYFIDWKWSSEYIKRFIDAVGTPYLGARTNTSKGNLVVIEEAEVINDEYCELRHVGKVLFVNKGMPVIICGNGLIQIKKAYEIINDKRVDFLPIKSFRTRFI